MLLAGLLGAPVEPHTTPSDSPVSAPGPTAADPRTVASSGDGVPPPEDPEADAESLPSPALGPWPSAPDDSSNDDGSAGGPPAIGVAQLPAGDPATIDPEGLEARAVGGKGHTPLPPPPRPVDPRTLRRGPWRGRGWFEVRAALVVPLAGEGEARSSVLAGAGGFTFGYRPLRILAVYGGVSTFVHGVEREVEVDEFGDSVEVVNFGRMVAFDLAVVRAYVPMARRVQPWADVGAAVATYRAPGADRSQAAGLGRFGLGLDIWVGSMFTVSVHAAYRLIGVDSDIAHRLDVGLGAAVHW